MKFKNGKHYFRIGSSTANRQYVKSYNLGPIIGTNIENLTTPTDTGEKAIATVRSKNYTKTAIIYKFDKNDKGTIVKKVPNGTKLTVDRAEYGSRSDAISFSGNAIIYHIKGTDNWIHGNDIKVNKNLTAHNYERY